MNVLQFLRAGAWVCLALGLGACQSVSTLEVADGEIPAGEKQKVCEQLSDFRAAQPQPGPQGPSVQDILQSQALQTEGGNFGSVLKDWEHLTFIPFKLPTQFSLQECTAPSSDLPASKSHKKLRFLSVDARSSASSMVHSVGRLVTSDSHVRWKWWVAKPNLLAKTHERSLEDSPVRVVLAFDGDKSKLSEDDRGFLSRMEFFTQRTAPYATLMYSIGGGVEKYEVVTPQYTKTIRIKAVQTVADRDGVGRWRVFDRNISEDFERAFGEKPGRLMHVAIMGDADNTKSHSKAYIADLELVGLGD